jgi:hypothetical protein
MKHLEPVGRIEIVIRTYLFAHADRSENKMRANIGVFLKPRIIAYA